MPADRPDLAYLDHAATTPMSPAAAEVLAHLSSRPGLGNPSSLHSAGREARRVLEEAREQLAAALGAQPRDVIFTGGGTEADNLALKGVTWARMAADPRPQRLLVSAVEHHAVSEPAQWLAAHEQVTLEHLAVDSDGVLDLEALRAALDGADPVAMISLMWANNETGAVQPVAAAAAVAARAGVPLHTDAVQAVGAVQVDFRASGAAALSLSGHKVGGPPGVGALLLAPGVTAQPLIHGGGQEREVRSGTPAVALVASFATAVTHAVSTRESRARRLSTLRDRLVQRVRDVVPDARVNGPLASGGETLPGIANIWFPGCEGDALLMLLDAAGVCCSTGSACSSGVPEPSHVLLAAGAGEARSRGSLRFSLGATSTDDDVDALAAALPGVVRRARRAGMLRLEPPWGES